MKAYQCGYVKPEGPALDDPTVIIPAFRCPRVFNGPAAIANHMRFWHKAEPEKAEYKEVEINNICHSCGREPRPIKPDGEISRVCDNCAATNLWRILVNKGGSGN